MNLFGSTEDMKKIKIKIICDLTVSRTNEKKMSGKKSVQKIKLEWATAYFGVESQYNVLYRDMHGLGVQLGVHGKERHNRAGALGHAAGAATRCSRPYDTAGLRAGRAAARAPAWPLGVSRYKVLYCGGGAAFVSRHGLRHDVGAL